MRWALVVALVVIATAAVGVILANHFEYAVEHPESEIESLDGYENWIMYNWAVEDTDVVWKSDPAIRADVITAISHWTETRGST